MRRAVPLSTKPRMPKFILQNTAMFGTVGVVGFAIDGGILTVLNQHFEWNVYLSRACSFLGATVATWILNRIFVFKHREEIGRDAGREYGRYVSVQIAGALINLGVFYILIDFIPEFRDLPIVPLAIGAIFGMAINYTGAQFWVFVKRS